MLEEGVFADLNCLDLSGSVTKSLEAHIRANTFNLKVFKLASFARQPDRIS